MPDQSLVLKDNTAQTWIYYACDQAEYSGTHSALLSAMQIKFTARDPAVTIVSCGLINSSDLGDFIVGGGDRHAIIVDGDGVVTLPI